MNQYEEAVAVAGGMCEAHGHRTTKLVTIDGIEMCEQCAEYHGQDPRPEAWSENDEPAVENGDSSEEK
jgi:hypothetical protein